MKVFGCVTFPHIPKDEREKLDSKVNKCIFLGYGAQRKGYRLYDNEKSIVFFSQDVEFNEYSRGIDTGKEETQVMEFEFLEDTQLLSDEALKK